jgi:hypothetical protein
MAGQGRQHLVGQGLGRLPLLGPEAPKKGRGQQRDVLPALAQRRLRVTAMR